ncbi:MAG: DNA translocase FtsK [Chitinispirillaceae bacterium]|nr:DNA translocase FtsK [Chitinispirillaceae bacterium]
MAREKKERKRDGKDSRRTADFGHEIWGLVYMAVAVLVLVALVSRFVNHGSNILGQYLGSALADGLVFLFGPVPAFFFPAAIGYIGWLRIRGDQISVRALFFKGILTAEICAILAVHTLPLAAAGKLNAVDSNWIGVSAIKLLKPLFGAHEFGPYFIIGCALAVTMLLILRISPVKAGKALAAAGIRLYSLAVGLFKAKSAAVKTRDAAKAETKEDKSPSEPATARSRREIAEACAVPDAEAAAVPAKEKELDPVEEEQRRQFEQELAAFRAKKREPIQIMTVETAEFETEEPVIDADQVAKVVEEEKKEDEENIKEEGKPEGRPRRRRAAAAPADAGTAAEQGEPAAEAVPEEPAKPYEIPKPEILSDPPALSSMIDKEAIERNSMVLEKTLANFGVEGKVQSVSPGPVVTRYEIVLAPGIKINKVVNLHNDIAMAVGGQLIRIEAPIPGKTAVGIELPNTERQIVHFKHILTSETFTKSKAKLPIIIGTNISGAPYVTDIAKMPHMLIAGQTGSGKSVCINSLICSMLMTKKPEELRLIMVDPKMVELSVYNGIPHLLSPVVTETKEAVKALHWGVLEMERRYKLLAKVAARNIDSFNSRCEEGKLKDQLSEEDNKPLPFIVIIVDELADLMTKASRDVETLVQRIAQLARAVGIHLIVATQRPSVDIITGPIKANLTSRIAFRTIQSNDSRTILDHIGAEKLLGLGDMLFLRSGAPQIERFHGSFISEEDVDRVVTEVRRQDVKIFKIESFKNVESGEDDDGGDAVTDGSRDELFEEAAHIIVDTGLGSTSLLQRRLNLGYARAGRIMDQLHDAGMVGPPNGSKARDVLVRPDELDDALAMLRQQEQK